MQVWNSNIAWSPPWETSGWYGRVGSQELGAREDRVDDRRHVVVVHPGAEEAELGIGVRVLGRERAQVLEDVLLGHAVRQVERPVEPDLGRDLLEELLGRLSPDLGEHRLAVGSRSLRCSETSRLSLEPCSARSALAPVIATG